jgi:HNH endonuclease
MRWRNAVEVRPEIPAEIRRRVLVEAGHRCAIPTCRHIDVDVHHIVPWSQCQAHEYDNLIALCPNCHRRADAGQIDRKSLRLYKLNLRFAHDKYSQLEMDVLFALNQLPHDRGMPWVGFNLILLKRLLESEFIGVHELTTGMLVGGDIKTTPDLIYITPRGRQFITDLGLKES